MNNVILEADANVVGGRIKGNVENKGIFSQVTIEPNTILVGGRLTGYVVNRGKLMDFEFIGAEVVGGTVGGVIVNNSKVGGTLKDVNLAENSHIFGGNLAGDITGYPGSNALLENLTVKSGSRLAHVTIGKGIKFEDDVSLGEGVVFTNPNDDPRNIEIASTNSEDVLSNDESVLCRDELPELGAIVTGGDSEVANIAAYVVGGISVNGSAFQKSATLRLSDVVSIKGEFRVDLKHVGQKANVVVYAAYAPFDSPELSFYMLGEEGKVLPWDQDTMNLVPFRGNVVLGAVECVDVYDGQFMAIGRLSIHIGYQLEEGTLVVSDEAIHVTITE